MRIQLLDITPEQLAIAKLVIEELERRMLLPGETGAEGQIQGFIADQAGELQPSNADDTDAAVTLAWLITEARQIITGAHTDEQRTE